MQIAYVAQSLRRLRFIGYIVDILSKEAEGFGGMSLFSHMRGQACESAERRRLRFTTF